MSIEINNESGVAVDEAALVRLSAYGLDFLHVHPDADLAIVLVDEAAMEQLHVQWMDEPGPTDVLSLDRKSTRLNSSHVKISYAVFCLKKKKKSTSNHKYRKLK